MSDAFAIRHVPVLVEAVLAAARGVQPSGARRVVDATLGDGGHSERFLATGAEVLGIDRDQDAIDVSRRRLGETRMRYVRAPYASDDALAAVTEFAPDFLLLDLGVSSRQLDHTERGFTFRAGAPLNMRMGGEDDDAPTAAEVLNETEEAELARMFAEYGDEPKARRLAREVVRRRARARMVVSDDFVNAIRASLGARSGPPDFARLFQAIRIAVNDELAGLERALPVFRDALTPGGRLAIITYHSGEDRLVKHTFREWATACLCPPAHPICTCRGRALGRLEPRKPIEPDAGEIAANPRARSARLRIFQRADAA